MKIHNRHHLCLAVLALSACLAASDSSDDSHDAHEDSHDHGHDEEASLGSPEYIAVYSLAVPGSYELQLGVAGEEAFGEESLEFMLVPSSSADSEGLEEAEEATAAVWADFASGSQEATLVNDGSAIPSRDVVYTVSLTVEGGSSSSSSSSRSSRSSINNINNNNNDNNDNNDTPQTIVVPLTISFAGAYTLLVSHGVDEVPQAVVSPSGEALVPVATESVDEHGDENESVTGRQWGEALTASFLVSMCSFVGIITVVSKRIASKINLSYAFLFASGALLTTAIVHIIPEALEQLEAEHPDNAYENALNAGIAVMAGLFGGFLLHVALLNAHSHVHELAHTKLTAATAAVGDDDTIVGSATAAATAGTAEGETDHFVSTGTYSSALIPPPANVSGGSDGGGGGGDAGAIEAGKSTSNAHGGGGGAKSQEGTDASSVDEAAGGVLAAAAPVVVTGLYLSDINNTVKRGLFDVEGLDPVCWNVIVGDLTHNFADGVTMGAAFLGCSSTVGWTVTAATIMHEIPHEIGNFMALVNGGMTVPQALLYNFISALAAVLGVVLTLGLRDFITDTVVAYLLLLGAGTFIFVGLSELLPDGLETVYEKGFRRRTQLHQIMSFTFGAVLLGIPLLVHQHCEAEGEEHNHG